MKRKTEKNHFKSMNDLACEKSWCFSGFSFLISYLSTLTGVNFKKLSYETIFLKVYFISFYKSPLANSKSMHAFMALVPTLYQVNVKTVPPGESQVMYDKNCGYVLRSEAWRLRQSLTFINVIHVPFNKREAK